MSTLDRARVLHGVIAGLAGGAAFAAVMKLDISLSGSRIDDFQLLAGFGPMRGHWRIVGPIVHTINSASLGVIYASVADRLPGSGWQRGLAFALTENIVLWPILVALDRIHPAIRAGELPPFNRLWPFVAESLRHASYGIVLGAIYERLSNQESASASCRRTLKRATCPHASRC